MTQRTLADDSSVCVCTFRGSPEFPGSRVPCGRTACDGRDGPGPSHRTRTQIGSGPEGRAPGFPPRGSGPRLEFQTDLQVSQLVGMIPAEPSRADGSCGDPPAARLSNRARPPNTIDATANRMEHRMARSVRRARSESASRSRRPRPLAAMLGRCLRSGLASEPEPLHQRAESSSAARCRIVRRST